MNEDNSLKTILNRCRRKPEGEWSELNKNINKIIGGSITQTLRVIKEFNSYSKGGVWKYKGTN